MIGKMIMMEEFEKVSLIRITGGGVVIGMDGDRNVVTMWPSVINFYDHYRDDMELHQTSGDEFELKHKQ